MRTQIIAVASALAASVAAHSAVPEITARQTVPDVKLPVLSWQLHVGIVNWSSPYGPGPYGYSVFDATWAVFAPADYISGLPGFAVTCSGEFFTNNSAVGDWTLCSGFPGSATVEGQLTGASGSLASVRHNVTQDEKTTVVVASGRPGSGPPYFEIAVQSVTTVG
ncbi:hypothetical protein EKO27_g7012 [Xylaria grammica]|uniref:Uncharacterized protein n=1 Tax=Xylaria grammica TaxID=363999 RepID=A0A439D0X1_9PEZI|nr:hypothetical protein EKO27_g7012 [Xylaria grammica]